eukprot:1362648-Amorphochlora_amoeboformis.AAC.1
MGGGAGTGAGGSGAVKAAGGGGIGAEGIAGGGGEGSGAGGGGTGLENSKTPYYFRVYLGDWVHLNGEESGNIRVTMLLGSRRCRNGRDWGWRRWLRF